MKKSLAIYALAMFSVSFSLLAIASGTSKPTDKNYKNLSDPAIKAGFTPHKALYEIDLVSTKSGSQIINIDGQMMYEWRSNCDAWNTKHKFNLRYEYADAPPLSITSDFTTYEPFDGKSLNFTSQRKRDGQVFEKFRGYANIDDKKSPSKAIFTIPEGLEYTLPAHTLFPVRHTIDVLNKIKANKKFFKATIFDGSDQDGPLDINAFLGKKTILNEKFRKNKEIDIKLLDNDAWKLRLGFFPLHIPEETADYEMSLIFHENGIISDMVVEYKDFSISQKLVALEELPSSCDTISGMKE